MGNLFSYLYRYSHRLPVWLFDSSYANTLLLSIIQTIMITVQSTARHSIQKVTNDFVLTVFLFPIMLKLEIYETTVIPNAISSEKNNGHYNKDCCKIIKREGSAVYPSQQFISSFFLNLFP